MTATVVEVGKQKIRSSSIIQSNYDHLLLLNFLITLSTLVLCTATRLLYLY